MDDRVIPRTTGPLKGGRTIVLLMDCMRAPEKGGLFARGSEGLFLLRLAALLASGSGGRVLVFKLLGAPEGESLSAYSTRAQEMRRELERDTLAALLSAATPAEIANVADTTLRASTLLDEVRAYVAELAANVSPRSLAVMKDQVYRDLSLPLDAAIREADARIQASLDHPDAKEGVVSFVERRPPRFQPWTGGRP